MRIPTVEEPGIQGPGPRAALGNEAAGKVAVFGGIADLLRCPVCHERLVVGSGDLLCSAPRCKTRHPVIDSIPILLNEHESVFTRSDFVARRNTTFELSRSRLKERIDQLLPVLGKNWVARENYERFGQLLRERSPDPVVLVIGGSIPGQGMQALKSHPGIRFVETDVSFGPCTRVICDARDLPFADQTFDGVIIQAVLQYVADPGRCVSEIARVLKPGGVVYAETAFMQQVAHGRYDFTRFTHLGLLRLFARFDEVRSGPVAGPGMVLAWAAHYFILAMAVGRRTRAMAHLVSRCAFWWLKHLDRWLLNRAGTYDAASGFYFLGRLGARTLTDREIIRFYRGAQ
jgi:SAM-dependent methyltransferase/uncharacterized protein YbaR (Trm112 family)